MKFTTLMMGIVIIAAVLVGGTSLQLQAYKYAGTASPATETLNDTITGTFDEVNASMQNINAKLQDTVTAKSTTEGLFSLFQLIPSVMVDIPLAMLSFMSSVPMNLFNAFSVAIPWIPGWVSAMTALLLLIFVSIKLYHSIRGTGEV